MKVSSLAFQGSANYKVAVYDGTISDGYVSIGQLLKSNIAVIITDLTGTTVERVLRERSEAMDVYYYRASFRFEDVNGILREGRFLKVTHTKHPTLGKFVSIPVSEQRIFTISYVLKSEASRGVIDVILTIRGDI